MEFALPRPAGVLARLGAASREALRGLGRSNARPAEAVGSRQALVSLLDIVAETAQELSAQVAVSDESQPLANAAAICRWQLARLRARAEAIQAWGPDRRLRAEIIRHLTEGMEAAQVLSTGYRFHSLERICRGGQALDDHLEALARIRVKLAAQL